MMTAPIPPALSNTVNSLCEFDFSSLDVDFFRSGSSTHPWTEGVWFDAPNPTADIKAVNGQLVLTWHKAQAVPHTDVSGRIAFGHGYFEANLDWDRVPGAWPAVWMLPIEGKVNPSIAQAGEFDVMESISLNPTQVYFNLHLWGPGGVAISDENETFNGLTAGPHTYAINWTPGKMTCYVDGKAYGTVAVPASADAQHYFLVLTINAGLNWLQDPATLAKIAAQQISMYVNWVRVWQ